MRRRLQKFLPVVLIALVIQILAPIAACWATAFAVSDPLGALEICHGGPVSGQTDQGEGAGCPICCVLQASVSLDAPQVVTLAKPPLRNIVGVLTGHEAPPLPAARAGSNSQARAPPQAI